jgi:hypothetical protein
MVGEVQACVRVFAGDEVGRWSAAGTICDICERLGWNIGPCIERQGLEAIAIYISRDATGSVTTDGGRFILLSRVLEALESREAKIALDARVEVDLY